jgi:hypothetical protein
LHGFYAVDGPASRRKFVFGIVYLGASRWPPQIVIRYVSEGTLDWLFAVLSLLCVVVAGGWFWRRRRIDRGLTCWNCGANLSHVRLYVDLKGHSRCPKCGNEMEVTDTYKMPS